MSGTAFGGARKRTDVPRIVDWYVAGKIEIDSVITHTLALAYHVGEHPQSLFLR
jgi:S-(hydroxymethyl)glutathione dehydrogenase / alcohol dehydrogenase